MINRGDSMSEMAYEFDEILEQIHHTLKTDDKHQFKEIFLENHTYDQAQIYLSLSVEQRQLVYQYLSPEDMAPVFEIIEEDVEDVEEYLREMDERYAARMLAEMYADNAVDILQQVQEDEVRKYLRMMPHKTSNEIRVLLNYEDDTAGAMMTTEIIAIHESQTVGSAMTTVKKMAEEAETIYYVYVVDEENRLKGVLTLKDLIVHKEDVKISEIMVDRVVSVEVQAAQDAVAKMIRDYDFLAIPVIDEEEKLIGIITVDDAIDVIDEEATSDYSGLAGVDVDEQSVNPFIAASKRLPWLISLLFLGLTTAALLSRYEGIIGQVSVLSIFITLITGTAGNAGTQSLAVAVRKIGLTEDEPLFIKTILSEVATGIISGIATGLIIFVVVGLWQANWILGGIIGVSMFFAITVATIAGSLIPLLIDSMGFDPSFASGLFITTVSDLTSVFVYFTIASMFLEKFLGN